jgi:hypothetical protein
MQRLYPMFPLGGPGLALVLLRMAVSAHLAVLAAEHPYAIPANVGLLLLAALVTLGLLTPLASAAAAISQLAMAIPGDGLTHSAVLLLLDPVLLFMLGPGAYSCDCRLFGRRLITFSD